MSQRKQKARERGISNLIAALILIATAVVGGSFVFVSFYSQMQTMTKSASLRAQGLDVVSTPSGDLVSATVKNNGTTVLESVKVKIINRAGDNVVLSVGHLPPGQTGSDHRSGDWGLNPGETYPVLITAEGPEGKKIISKATSVRSVG